MCVCLVQWWHIEKNSNRDEKKINKEIREVQNIYGGIWLCVICATTLPMCVGVM